MPASPSTTDRGQLERRFTAALGPLRQALRREFDVELAPYGLSTALAHPLLHLRERGGVRQGELAERLDVEGPTLVRLVDQLEAMELVERRPDPADLRAKTLHLTAAGLALTRRIAPVIEGLRARLLADVSDRELERTVALFDRLLAALARHRP